jgi:hypothetical protein
MAERLLPPEFSDLEPLVEDWCLDSEPERYAKRLASTMDEIQFPLDDLPDDALRLLKLLYSLILMSFPVEIWKQPYIPDTGTAQFDLELEPVP